MANMIKAADLPKGYEPTQVEAKWYDFWLKKGYFKGDDNSSKPPFSVVIPPPNVTGVLHMGHALNCTIQDIMVRFKRMQGFNAVWIPGMDHAGISTQIVVEKMLLKEGIKREQLGRDKFVEKVWEWKEKSGGMILSQQKRLGVSVDWSRAKFTLDEDMSFAVKKVFVDLYNEKLIYRGFRLVNWCPRCQTAVSDLEVKHQDIKGTLWHIKYPIKGSSDFVVVATTRPETMLGDTAVAVHPKDDRYKKLVGKMVSLPLTNREIPVIADDSVEKDFGSGVVKITPAHDFNDYETGLRHKLPMISIFDKKAIVNENGGAYKGLKNVDARKKVLEDLTAQGFLVKEEPHPMSVGKCERCDNVIEPMLSDQWFVKIQPLADKAIKVVETGEIKFTPENWKKTYLEWLYNIKDWCISRQLWWGHRIPAWHCEEGHITVSMDDVSKCKDCGKSVKQDEDVLDTWFSSWLWPMNTMGWPQETVALKKYFPTSLLVTGFDIIFFWVARMVMAATHFKKQIPFKDVYIHALVRDERGAKMSKSKGNAVDPLDLINDYGTDSLRFTLASLVGAGRDIKFSEDRLDGYRNFINKIWNATRFCLGGLENVPLIDEKSLNAAKLTLPDKYIVYELQQTIGEATEALEEYRFTDAANALYKFTWNEFCDWYVELSKPVLYGDNLDQKSVSGSVLLGTLERLVKLIHPFTPFVTEEVYQLLPNHGESICIQPYPTLKDDFLKLADKKSADEIEIVKSVVSTLRNIRGENRISPAIKIKITVQTNDAKTLEVLKHNETFITTLGRLEVLNIVSKMPETRKSAVSLVTIGNTRIQVIVPLEGLVDFNEEIKRLNKELEKVGKDFDLTQKKLDTPTFMQHAPPEIIEQERTRIAQLTDKKKQILESLQRLQ